MYIVYYDVNYIDSLRTRKQQCLTNNVGLVFSVKVVANALSMFSRNVDRFSFPYFARFVIIISLLGKQRTTLFIF